MRVALTIAGTITRWIFRLILVTLIIDVVYVWQLWRQQPVTELGPVPESRLIANQRARIGMAHWQPVAMHEIPDHVVRAVLIAEDARFYYHAGFDLTAIRSAIWANLQHRRLAYGASTISQQTAKNLFLTPERSWLRKWHEALLTAALEVFVSKQRILEIYLNTAQFGSNVYGVEAAASYYWDKPVALLSLRQAAELAASLPAPSIANPRTRNLFFTQHSGKIHRRLLHVVSAKGAARL